MWCWQEGYTDPADRAILANWLLEPVESLNPEDAVLRTRLLQMADEVLNETGET